MSNTYKISRFQLSTANNKLKLNEEELKKYSLFGGGLKGLIFAQIEVVTKNPSDIIVIVTERFVSQTITPIFLYSLRPNSILQDGKYIFPGPIFTVNNPIGMELDVIAENGTQFDMEIFYEPIRPH